MLSHLTSQKTTNTEHLAVSIRRDMTDVVTAPDNFKLNHLDMQSEIELKQAT